MPTYGYVTKSRLLSLVIFSTMSILNYSGWERWQDAENPVRNWQADSIKVLNTVNIGSTGLKNYSPVKSNSAGSLSHCPQHRFQFTKAQSLKRPLVMGHFAFRVQTKIKITGKITGTTEDRILTISKNLCDFIQNTSRFRCQLCNDIHSKTKGGECGKGVPGFNERSLLSCSNTSLPYKQSNFKAQNYILNFTEGCRRLNHLETRVCV